MRMDFSQVQSLRELSSDEWIQFKQSDPARYVELEAQLNGGSVQKTGVPRMLERSRNGLVQSRDQVKEVRFINGILQS
jgi:hypothetical protein